MRKLTYFMVVTVLFTLIGQTLAARVGVPLQRYWTGLPGNNGGAWVWDPNGETPGGQVPCDGLGHTSAITQAAVSGWIVNNQFSIGLDNGASAFITAYLVRLRNEIQTIIDQATIFHPTAGFSIDRGSAQNRFHILQAGAKIQSGDILGLVVKCTYINPGPQEFRGPCTVDRSLPCAAALSLYGFTTTFPGQEQ